jgi:hypothetical protein
VKGRVEIGLLFHSAVKMLLDHQTVHRALRFPERLEGIYEIVYFMKRWLVAPCIQ